MSEMMKPEEQFTVNLTVNGVEYSYSFSDKDFLLIDYLREVLHLTGTKRGCNERACGACTVLIDGKAQRSCHTKLVKVDGAQVVTIEGLADMDGNLDYVQQAFVDNWAIQCGFCTPGLIMASHSLLATNDNPTEEEIKKALNINLCRCGTYPRVIAAVKQAAAIKRGEAFEPYVCNETEKPLGWLGKPMLRHDFHDKVTGSTKFFADIFFDNMIHGKAVYSEYAHARVLSIDTSEAKDAPGVVCVLTHEDVPGSKYFGGGVRDQQVFVIERAKWRGEVIACVFAETAEQAAHAAELIKVEYEELPGVYSIEEALAPDAPLIPDAHHPDQELEGFYLNGKRGNICREFFMKRGDLDAAFAECDVVVEDEYTTPWEEHGYMEADGTVSRYDEEGRVTVYAPNQDPFGDYEQLVEVLGLPEDKVRVVNTAIGGGFGGKLELTTHALCAIATMKTGRPAKMVLTRAESIRMTTKRHPYSLKYKLGVTADGKIKALHARAYCDAGPYVSWSHRTIEQGISWGGGPYEIPVIDMKGVAVYTNNPVCGAMRGFGANQTHFAMESILDAAARAINIDPIEIRKINAIDYGKLMTTGQIMDKRYIGTAYPETLKLLEKSTNERLKPLMESLRAEGKIVGFGVASGWRSIGGGMGRFDSAGAHLKLETDGKLMMKVSCVEMGQGALTSLVQIAGETSGVNPEDIEFYVGDTANVPYGGHVSASRGVFLWGYPVMFAGRGLNQKLVEELAERTGYDKENLSLKDSVFYLEQGGNSTALMTLAEFTARYGTDFEYENTHTLSGTCPVRSDTNENGDVEDYRPHYTSSYTTAGVVVEVVPETGAVLLHDVCSVMEAGRIINPEAASIQIEGCVIMGAGYALTNTFKVEHGVIKTDSFGKIKVPRIGATPRNIEVLFAEQEDASAPFGAKGLAEIGILSMAPAITNAIYDAVGLRITDLPVADHSEELKEACKVLNR